MSRPVVIVEGTVKSDGTLEVSEKVKLPAGRVQVTLVPLPELPEDDPFWQRMKTIWAGQDARGYVPRSDEGVEAERQALRDEWEERMAEIARIQGEARRLRGRGRHG